MIRLLMFLLGKEYEPCKTCALLKQQLEIVNQEKKELIETLSSFVKPAEVIVQENKEIRPIRNQALPWRKRQTLLENEGREALRIRKEQKKLDESLKKKPVEELEKELGINGL